MKSPTVQRNVQQRNIELYKEVSNCRYKEMFGCKMKCSNIIPTKYQTVQINVQLYKKIYNKAVQWNLKM